MSYTPVYSTPIMSSEGGDHAPDLVFQNFGSQGHKS